MENQTQFNRLNQTHENEIIDKGKNVQIHLIFLRHGDKDKDGSLTEEGKKEATDFGEKLEGKDAIKGYSSPVPRALETVERVIAGAPHGKKLTTRIRTELGIRPCSKDFFKKFREKENEGFGEAAEWYLSYGEQKPDAETSSPHEIAEDLAFALDRFIRMSDRLNSGSNIDLVNGTHQSMPEALLKEIMVREKEGKKIVGFEKLEEIGGALQPTESMEFLIKTDGSGEKELKLYFRGHEYDLDMNIINKLVGAYRKRTKKTRIMNKLILPFQELTINDVNCAGGKGASLGELAKAGVPVPDGFVLLSSAFDQFLKDTDLIQEIEAILSGVNHKKIHTVENASEKIQFLIISREMPENIKIEILKFYKKLDNKLVAVRSSATSEDSASAAWAGQLESYLNTTEETLLENVKKCWASLFTPRAIFYRFEKRLRRDKISVAVVVQKMIDAEESGIAFSVHPVTQDENQIIIEAGFGLGEAIVSGSITPDSYVIEKQRLKIIDINVNEQKRALYKKSKGGSAWKNLGEMGKTQVLTEKEIIALSKIIIKIENHYGFPCDIEWAKEKGNFYIVQSRPITTLRMKRKNRKFDLKKGIIVPSNISIFDIDRGSNYFSVVSRKSVLLIRSCFPWGYCDNNRYKKIFGFPSPHKPFYDSQRNIFVDKGAIVIERKEALIKIKRDNNYLYKIANRCQEDGDSLWRESLKIKNADFSKKTDKELLSIFKKGIEDEINLCAYLMFPLSLQGFFEESIKKQIAQNSQDQKTADYYFQILTTPARQNFGYFEQIAILKLAAAYQRYNNLVSIDKKIYDYLFKFDILGTKYGTGKMWSKKEIIARIKYLSKQSPQRKLKYLLNLPGQSDKQVKEVLIKLKADKDFRELIRITRLYVYLRTYRTDIISGAFANMFSLFEEIAKRNGLDSNLILECLPNEIIDNNFPDKKIIIKRATTNIIRGVDGKIYCVFGNKAIKVYKKLLINAKQVAIKKETKKENFDELPGVIANAGFTRGFVRIVLDNSEINKVKAGDILVSSMTTPDFVPAMEKASAFITDEGGVLCHAAIISREMQKPCIIGTGRATTVLKDDDLVEVDANRGIVRILKKVKQQ